MIYETCCCSAWFADWPVADSMYGAVNYSRHDVVGAVGEPIAGCRVVVYGRPGGLSSRHTDSLNARRPAGRPGADLARRE